MNSVLRAVLNCSGDWFDGLSGLGGPSSKQRPNWLPPMNFGNGFEHCEVFWVVILLWFDGAGIVVPW